VRGSCLCGGVAWEVAGDLVAMSHCHCSMCRKLHGAAFATYVGAAAKAFRWLGGVDLVTHYESSPGFDRSSCSRCGSVVPGDPTGGLAFMSAGCLDDDPGVRPQAHIFVSSKAPWHEICDDLPRFDAYPPGWDAPSVSSPGLEPGRQGVTRGSCLCGGVTCEIEGQIELIRNCHCSRCRKARAAAHASNLFVAPARFRFTGGEERVQSFEVPGAKRFKHCFCRVCGSSQPSVAADYVVVPAGCLDDDPGAREQLHIYVGSKAPWYEIADDLPQHRAHLEPT